MSKTHLMIIGTVLYIVVITAVVWGLLAARSRMASAYSTAAGQEHWEEFREEMDRRHFEREALREKLARRSGQPIEAAPPKSRSERPPALELLENHFAACLVVSVGGATLLFVIVWGLFVGAVLRPGRVFEEPSPCDSSLNRAPEDLPKEAL